MIETAIRHDAAADRHAVRGDAHVVVRRAGGDDHDAIVDLYEGLGPRSRHQRFLVPVHRIDGAARAELVAIDGAIVWLAFAGGRCVGEARVVPSSRDGCAELAVTVADEFQGHGIGPRLARLAVGDHLRTHERVRFTMLADNVAAVRLARSNRIPLRADGAVLEGVIAVP